ncbi:hypothetical protein [Archangium sp. Cb G35]|uniref:hypothetical protein n=1 Tax=Archangium sp. Cb G35 TaxID=1920190 RepID=UPI000A611FDA|nr:hypothetical protein [Archangium sp. Cb G35]
MRAALIAAAVPLAVPALARNTGKGFKDERERLLTTSTPSAVSRFCAGPLTG